MIKKVIDRINLYRAEVSDKGRDEVLNLLFKLWNLMNDKGKISADNYMNASVYILLVNRDIFYLYNLYYFEKSPSKKNFFGRMLSMTIFEYLLDVNHLIGKSMIQEVEKNKWNPELIVDLKSISKSYSNLKNKFENELRETRNNAAAHKVKDSKKLYEYTKMDYSYLKIICPIIRLIEIEFERVSMKFEQISE